MGIRILFLRALEKRGVFAKLQVKRLWGLLRVILLVVSQKIHYDPYYYRLVETDRLTEMVIMI